MIGLPIELHSADTGKKNDVFNLSDLKIRLKIMKKDCQKKKKKTLFSKGVFRGGFKTGTEISIVSTIKGAR